MTMGDGSDRVAAALDCLLAYVTQHEQQQQQQQDSSHHGDDDDDGGAAAATVTHVDDAACTNNNNNSNNSSDDKRAGAAWSSSERDALQRRLAEAHAQHASAQTALTHTTLELQCAQATVRQLLQRETALTAQCAEAREQRDAARAREQAAVATLQQQQQQHEAHARAVRHVTRLADDFRAYEAQWDGLVADVAALRTATTTLHEANTRLRARCRAYATRLSTLQHAEAAAAAATVRAQALQCALDAADARWRDGAACLADAQARLSAATAAWAALHDEHTAQSAALAAWQQLVTHHTQQQTQQQTRSCNDVVVDDDDADSRNCAAVACDGDGSECATLRASLLRLETKTVDLAVALQSAEARVHAAEAQCARLTHAHHLAQLLSCLARATKTTTAASSLSADVGGDTDDHASASCLLPLSWRALCCASEAYATALLHVYAQLLHMYAHDVVQQQQQQQQRQAGSGAVRDDVVTALSLRTMHAGGRRHTAATLPLYTRVVTPRAERRAMP